ncbi:peptidase inhibitor family I36 protein [Streptomyces sp. URMC 123]|uniref:peptidase inhibitor family I36 protein n=1 Tax=Streptomyces sp. URMC 123 TaxID=3423403 RepID=UPI003F1D8DFE
MRIRTRLALAAGAALLGGTAIAAPAAFADSGAPSTGERAAQGSQVARIWLYQHDDYRGGQYGFARNDGDLRDNTWTGASSRVNNGASSMKNQTGRDVVLYDIVGYGGRTYTARAHSSDRDFSNNGFDNKASAVKFR